jgi:hypothetical protein
MAATTGLLIAGGLLAGGSIAGGIISGNRQAEAAENAASEQARVAREVLAQQQRDRERALGLAQPSYQEMALIARQQELAEANLQQMLAAIDQDRQLLNSVDPALKSAGEQAYKLLQGQESSVLAPLRAERGRMREDLKTSLRDKLGSGYETSSAGIEALSRFDADSAGLMEGAQQQTLGTLLGVSASVRPNIAGEVGAAYGTTSQILGSALAGQQNIQGRQVNAFTGSPVNYQNVINTAGGQFLGDMIRAQTWGNAFNSFGQIGGGLIGYGLQDARMDKYLPRADVNGTFNIGGGGQLPAVGSFGGYGGYTGMVPSYYNSPNFGRVGG